MSLKNKKAQIGKVISSFPVMLLIFLVIAVYLILSVTIYGAKKVEGLNNLNIPEFSEDIFQDFQFKEISFKGEKISLFDLFLKININKKRCNEIQNEIQKALVANDYERKNQLNKELEECINYPLDVKEAIKSQIAEDSRKTSEMLCFIACLECNAEDGFHLPYNDIIYVYFIYKNGESDWAFNFKKPEVYSERNLDKKIRFNYELNGEKEEFNLVYYYGECLK